MLRPLSNGAQNSQELGSQFVSWQCKPGNVPTNVPGACDRCRIMRTQILWVHIPDSIQQIKHSMKDSVMKLLTPSLV